MRQTIVGLFDSSEEARKAENKLMERGFDRSRIDVSQRREGIDTHQTTTHTDRHDDDHDSIGSFFRSLFGADDDDAHKYSHVASKSNCIVTVHAETREEAEKAADILDDAGAIDIDDRAKQYGYTGTTNKAGYTTSGTATGTHDTLDTNKTGDKNTASMKVMEEDLQVGKRTVQTGGARLRSRIVERPVEEHLRLRKEHVTVDRKPVNRAATDAELNAFKEGKVEMTEKAEVPVVSKEARVVEEVSLNKKVDVKDETIRENVRKTEVDVEHFDDDDKLETSGNDTRYNENKRRY